MNGVHLMADLYGIDADMLNDVDFLMTSLEFSADVANMTVLEGVAHEFDPQGVTAILLLAESHISIHTYPENGSCFIDIFTCGEKAKPYDAMQILCEMLEPKEIIFKDVKRGKNG